VKKVKLNYLEVLLHSFLNPFLQSFFWSLNEKCLATTTAEAVPERCCREIGGKKMQENYLMSIEIISYADLGQPQSSPRSSTPMQGIVQSGEFLLTNGSEIGTGAAG
jgi:hypothetical protein